MSRRFLGVALAALVVSIVAAPGAVLAQNSPRWFEAQRERMVDQLVKGAGVTNPRVIDSMRKTLRHEFVPALDPSTHKPQRQLSYFDMSLPIGEKQTISAPIIVAYMTEQLDPQPGDRVLEIGTGSGYQAAVLSPLVKDVYSIEIVESLGKTAAATLKRLKYTNVHTKIGDGYKGWPDAAPFDKIIVTCSPEKVPQALVDQLRDGGRMIVPLGERYEQVLYLYKKHNGKLETEALRPTLFVPMTGAAEDSREVKPDPLHPHLVNTGFEELTGTSQEPKGWYYFRQLTVVTAADAPEGKRYVTFTNTTPGAPAWGFQGFAVDGTKVHKLELSCMVRGRQIVAGQGPEQLPALGITFYDSERSRIKHTFLGPWQGTFAWKRQSEQFLVPPKTREAIVQIGLGGGTGEASFDDVEVRDATKN